jgi:hypothetical protein
MTVADGVDGQSPRQILFACKNIAYVYILFHRILFCSRENNHFLLNIATVSKNKVLLSKN